MQHVTLKFHPNIQKYTNGIAEYAVAVNDLIDIRNSLEHLFPVLGIHMRRIRGGANRLEYMALVNKHRKVLDRMDYSLNRLTKDDTEFYVVPLFIGGGRGGFGKIALGAALVGLAIFSGGAAAPAALSFMTTGILGSSITLAGMAMSMGVSMMLSGVMGMLMKPSVPAVQGQQTTDSEARKENKIFQGLANTTASNTPVPLLYGRTRTGGQFISGEIRTFQHGKNETVVVANSFPSGAS